MFAGKIRDKFFAEEVFRDQCLYERSSAVGLQIFIKFWGLCFVNNCISFQGIEKAETDLISQMTKFYALET